LPSIVSFGHGARIRFAPVRHRVPADVLLLVTVFFWSFNFTVVGLTYRPFGKALLIAPFPANRVVVHRDSARKAFLVEQVQDQRCVERVE
jgi:hypothetical protein